MIGEKSVEKKHYGAVDGLRMIASIGIVMMHVRANSNYEIIGYIYNRIIPSFADFVFLFMMVSAFGMCCGYYDRVLHNQIKFSDFYGKRFGKILPFFGTLVLLDIIISPSVASFYEGFADLTLLFGFLPDSSKISVIGVGWFLGLIFVFYLLFPFFCVMLENKARAWMSFAVSLIYNFVCTHYFGVGRSNILYSACFFLSGGLLFLYRDQIAGINQWAALGIAGCAVVCYYVIGGNTVTNLLVSGSLLMYAIIRQGGVLENRVTKFFSGISMEIYLSHMVIFRVVEKLKLNRLWGNGWLQYIATCIMVIAGTTVFAIVMQIIFSKTKDALNKRKQFA